MDINEGCDSLEQGAEPNAIPFLHSEPAPLDDVTKSHLLTRFQPRRSKYSSVSHDACIECHVDLFGRAGVGKIIGGMNAYDGDFTALCAPEALPERIAFCSYFNEYAFVYDDTTVDAVQPTNPILEDAILTRALGIKKAKELTRPGDTQTKKQLLAKIWALLQEIDPDYLGRCHAKFIEWYETAKLMRDKHFTNLDAYLLNRALDCGANWVVRMMGWASGVVLTPEEEEYAGPVTYLAFIVLAVTNDIWSWEREKRVTRQSGGSVPLVNAVHVVMQTHNTDEECAKKIVSSQILEEHEERYCRLRDEYLRKPDISMSIKKWFRILELSIAGNALWSVRAIRYHQDVRNPYQGSFDFPSVFRSLKVTQFAPKVRSESEDIAEARPKNPALTPAPRLGDSILWKPYEYLTSSPSKDFCNHLIDALQEWYKLPQASLATISGIATLLHEASLMLDDIQDDSPLRRGKPAVHTIFGVGQTINSACYQINNALRLCLQLSPSAGLIFSDQLAHLFTGQAHDLHWARHKRIPTEEDYFRMVDGKNGALLTLISRLMQNEGTQNSTLDLSHLMNLIGRAYQLRDDYQNLASADYTTQRGFCQDLDEGKISYPLIRTIQSSDDPTILMEWLQQQQGNSNSHETKTFILGMIEQSGSLEATRSVLRDLSVEMMRQLEMIESMTGVKNWMLGSILAKLQGEFSTEKKESKKESSLEKVLRVWGGYRDEAWRDVLN